MVRPTLIALIGLQVVTSPVQRFPQNPILTPGSSPTIGENLNGPSLIRVPGWVDKPLAQYYLYFSHHAGKYIRLAYADASPGPWKIYEPGTLGIEEAPRCHDHVASPDVHVDELRREILMYFHCPSGGQAGKSMPTGGSTSTSRRRSWRRPRMAFGSGHRQPHSGPPTCGSFAGAATTTRSRELASCSARAT